MTGEGGGRGGDGEGEGGALMKGDEAGKKKKEQTNV